MPRLLRPSHAVPLAIRALRVTPRGASATTALRHSSSFLQTGPSPPRLPAEQQAEFERLQRAAEAALSSHNDVPSASAAAADSPLATSRHVSTPSGSNQTQTQTKAAEGGGEVNAGSFSGGIRKGAPPEFEGEQNPKTGEVGGPKNEPLRWGSTGDWSFNGRATDF
ncbi:DUF1674-domain-containing protein [Trichocladium antarcticum]|uniref:Succinate dehydrogenase assembly factor 4, mitochondrial n=1 Tax=Trichocladium antarcticum TaxID=1450529 RepID=A0AAN6ZB03_9PEZI|nr:DUF1674-domain-containing protein [Trichocladium antarcticum]